MNDSDSLNVSQPSACPCAGKCKTRKAHEAIDPSAPLPLPIDAGGIRSVESERLFAGTKTLHIRHSGENYRLLVTRNDKLILQK